MKGLFFGLFMVVSVSIWAQPKAILSNAVPDGAIQLKPEEMKWVDAPAPFLPGAKMTILEGNPKQEGVFTIRFKLPPNYLIAAHSHPKEERVTIISGNVYVGFGENKDDGSAHRFSVGSYYMNPMGRPHYVFTKESETILQITGIGPWSINFLHPHD